MATLLLACLVALLFGQLQALRYYSPADPDEGLGAFSLQLADGWRAKLAGTPRGKNEVNVREPQFLGPRDSLLIVQRILKPNGEIIRLLPKELDDARSNASFRDLNLKGYVGGFYQMPGGKRTKGVWYVGKTTNGKDLFSISITASRAFSDSEQDAIEAMLRSLRPEDQQ